MYSNIGRETQAESQGCRSWRFRQKEGQLLGLCTHEAGFLPVNQWAGSWGGIYCWWDTWTNHCTDVGCLWRAKQTTESKRKNAFVSELHLWLASPSFASMKGFWLPLLQCLPPTRIPLRFHWHHDPHLDLKFMNGLPVASFSWSHQSMGTVRLWG